MLKLTRTSGIPDTNRLANAVARPGIDPRTWTSYAVVTAVGRDVEGVFVDCTLMPSLQRGTARLGTSYAGPGFGRNVPIEVDDEVMVGISDGDPGNGLVVLARLHSASDPLPQAALDHPDDIVEVIKEGSSIRTNVSGSGKVYLGATEATEEAVLGTTYRSNEDALLSALSTFLSAFTVYTGAIATIADPLPGHPATVVVNLAAGALQAQIASFQALAASYLSQKVNIG